MSRQRPARRIAFLGAFLLALLGAAAAEAHPPYGLVVDASGNVYFSDLEAVWRLAPDGRLELFRPATAGHHVHELALGADGAIEGEVNRYDPETQTFYTGLWQRSADGVERWLLRPTRAALPGLGTYSDRRGNRYTAQWPSNDDRRTMLFRRSPDGRVGLLYGPVDEAARFRQVLVSSIGGMATTQAGELVFADGPVLRRIAPSGAVTTLFEAPPGSHLRGVSAARGGWVLAADIAGKAVFAVAPDGSAELLYREAEAWLPTAAVLTGGRLLVLEANADPREQADRMRLIEVADGRSRILARPGGAVPVAAAQRPSTEPARPGEDNGSGKTLAFLAAAAAGAVLVAVWVARRFRM